MVWLFIFAAVSIGGGPILCLSDFHFSIGLLFVSEFWRIFRTAQHASPSLLPNMQCCI